MQHMAAWLLALVLVACSGGEERQQLALQNMELGSAFLETNKSKEGVIVRPSGLQYMVLREGSGEKPTVSDSVKVDYRGVLIDGTEFDSSYARGEPAIFSLNGVIRGWTEGLQLMSVGSQYRFFVPSYLGYGSGGAGDKIGPDAMLIFDVELLAINEK